MIRDTIGHYRILTKLGAGGMGEVYRAHDQQLDRDVALKVLPADTFSDPAARARLLREARSAAALNHPHICTIHEVGEAEGQAYIAMELVEGQSVSTRLAEGPFPAEQVLRYGSQIAEALAHAHEHQIIHRDLKSANVVITGDGRAKVLDFGLAKRVTGEEMDEVTRSQASLTQPGAVMGTLAYMAPEQLRGEPADARSDIWALGVVLYEMATGTRPFQGRTGFDLSSAILNQRPEPLPAKIPVELRAVIDRCLTKEPGQRYQHAGEVRAALEAIQTGTAAPWASLSYRVRSHRWGAVAVVALVAAMVLAVAFDVRGLRTKLTGSARAPKIESLAVLPLENLSGDPNQDHLASGVQEALIIDLAHLSGIHKVIARASVMRFQKTDKSPRQIARELGVDAIVTGSVLRSGGRVQVTAHLIDAATEEQLWSDRYDREMSDVLVLENDIVRAITQGIKLQLTPEEQRRLASAPTVNPEAYEAYLQGRFQERKQTREDLDIAERYYKFALEKDPNFALAYAGLGAVWLARTDLGFEAPQDAIAKGTALLEKAVSMDDSSAEVHVWLANFKNAVDWDWASTEKEFQRAIALDPNSAAAHFFYADLLVCTKRDAEWEAEMHRARDLDPLNEFNESFYGWHLNYLHRYDEAIPIFQKLLSTGPNKGSNYLGLWGAYYKKGMYDDALAAARGYFETIHEQAFAGALGNGGGETAYRAAMRRVGETMAAQSKHRHVPAIRIARMFAHAGDKDRAIEWLEKAYQAHESPMIRLAVFWDWDSLRSDPRFQNLLHRMKLPL